MTNVCIIKAARLMSALGRTLCLASVLSPPRPCVCMAGHSVLPLSYVFGTQRLISMAERRPIKSISQV